MSKFIKLAALFLLATGAFGAEDKQTDLIWPNIEIEDQFKDKHRLDKYNDRLRLAIIFDRKGSDFYEEWFINARDSIADDRSGAIVVPIAHTKGAPFFIKGKIRSKFKEGLADIVFLDWKGKFYKRFDLAKDSCNLLVFNRDGVLIYENAGQEINIDILNETLAMLRGERAGE